MQEQRSATPKQNSPSTEPWMRGTHTDLDPLRRAVVHALEQTFEDAARWAGPLEEECLFARPAELPSVAFHLRHIARSVDRLLTYAEDRPLDAKQLAALGTEHAPARADEVRREFEDGIADALRRIPLFAPSSFDEPRGIGRKRLPTTVAGLLIHCAEHTQRHTGQMVTTAKLVLAMHAESS